MTSGKPFEVEEDWIICAHLLVGRIMLSKGYWRLQRRVPG